MEVLSYNKYPYVHDTLERAMLILGSEICCDGRGWGWGEGSGSGSTGGSWNAEDYNIWGGDRSYVKDCGWSVSYSGGSGNGMGDGFGSGGDE